ncbi:MAG: Two-component system, OmpR family, copper resistance phosphate regulon response regulator CusR [Phenylobacterium sp.]|jgi:DNA-binding response OmpR family regulator|nr:Two-component system, OmpR family, copper resistance phosphate regulon response regulator CusR [Phenylobacterium sp.]
MAASCVVTWTSQRKIGVTINRMKVLIVEDEARLGAFLKQGLSEHAHTANWVPTCRTANDALAETNYDLIVLDLNLPDGDGLDLVREWRASGFNEPVLILSARDSLEDRIKGLDVGADDYLPKPFSLEELLAKMRALLRRQSVLKQTLLERNGIRLDLLGHTVHVSDKPIDLTGREYALLEIFMQNGGRVLTRSLISEKIWSSHYDVDTNLLDVYMSRLRAKLEGALGRPVFKTVRGIGYQLL